MKSSDFNCFSSPSTRDQSRKPSLTLIHPSFPSHRVLAGTLVLGLAGVLFLYAATTPAETTPAEIPGTEMHVYRF